MIGDIFYFSEEGYSILAEYCDNSYLFYTVETTEAPRKFHVKKDQELIKKPLYSIVGCFHNELEPQDLVRGQTVYILNRARIRPYTFIANVNPDGTNKVKVVNYANEESYHPWWKVISFAHSFESIRGANAKKCCRCGCLSTQQYTGRTNKALQALESEGAYI